MSSGVRYPTLEAALIAKRLVNRFEGGCERIEVAGSLRRAVFPDVGDIEIVAVPKFAIEPEGLFGTAEINQLRVAVDLAIADGELVRLAGGDRYQKLRHVETKLQVDLFIVTPPATWGVIYLIRTGSAGFSERVVTLARKRAMHVADGALHRGVMGCGSRPCEVVPTPEESDVLAALGMPWVEPKDRL